MKRSHADSYKNTWEEGNAHPGVETQDAVKAVAKEHSSSPDQATQKSLILALEVGTYANKHFLRRFEKQYKSLWTNTWNRLQHDLQHIDELLQTTKAEIVRESLAGYIIKGEFTIDGCNQSAHIMGTRFIAYCDKEKKHIMLLMIYKKSDIETRYIETVWWQKCIKESYPFIKEQFPQL